MILTNARVVTPDAVLAGTVLVKDGHIAEISEGHSRAASSTDLEGDYLLPGLVEIHTDNLERNLKPRPGVYWPTASALIAHDAEIAASGVTTVFDALAIGDVRRASLRNQLLPEAVRLISEAAGRDGLRAEHRLHLRCEVSAANMGELLEPHARNPRIGLISLMDHTPGQRQWADVERFRHRNRVLHALSEAELDELVRSKRDDQARYAARNRQVVLALLAQRRLPLASHDDTTEADVDDAFAIGATISEFPTTEVAAAASRRRGLSIVMGAPNIILGGSHSGNVSAAHLASRGELDILSSDYVPGSLVQACWALHREMSLPLPQTVAMVSRNPARAVGLNDRGAIGVGQRADLVHVHVGEGAPMVRATWRGGRRVA
jgi:alpha-D-ribose 1-methylphosphonate 5-triphosphate diphosphatase